MEVLPSDIYLIVYLIDFLEISVSTGSGQHHMWIHFNYSLLAENRLDLSVLHGHYIPSYKKTN
jgi:hypothetical protein